MWSQVYDPFHNVWLSTLAAAIPVVVMLAALAFFHIKAHIAALMGLVSALVVAIWGFTMPADAAVASKALITAVISATIFDLFTELSASLLIRMAIKYAWASGLYSLVL